MGGPVVIFGYAGKNLQLQDLGLLNKNNGTYLTKMDEDREIVSGILLAS